MAKRIRLVLLFLLMIFPVSSYPQKEPPREPRGKNLLELNKFEAAISEFSGAIEKGKSQDALKNFLRIIRLKPNKEIVRRLAEVSGMRKLYPLAYNKPYDWVPVFSPDGAKIVYQSWQKPESGGQVSLNNALYVMDITGRNIRMVAESKYDNTSPVFSPDSRHIMFVSWRKDTNGDGKISGKDNRGIYFVDVDSKNERCVADETFQNNEPLFFPDGKTILFQSWRDDTCKDGKIDTADRRSFWLADTDGNNQRQLIGSQFINEHPAFSPDGRFVVFQRITRDTNSDGKIDASDNRAIYIVEVATGKERQLVSDRFDNEFSAFAPDGKNMAFFSRRGKQGQRAICLLNLENGSETTLVGSEYDNEFLAFSFDSRQIAYTSYRRDTNNDGVINTQDNRGIYVKGTGPSEEEILVVGDQFDNEFLAFYPDNRKIIFQSWRRDTNGDGKIDFLDNSSIFIVDIIGQPSVKISTVVRTDGSGTRVVEIVTDPLFRAGDELNRLIGPDWKIEYVQAGNYHFKALNEFKNVGRLSHATYPISFSRKRFFYITGQYREIFTCQEITRKTSENPFVSLGQEMSRSSAKPMVIQSRLTLPGKITATNASAILGSTMTWQFSMDDLQRTKRDYEMFADFRIVNWPGVVITATLFLLVFCGLVFRTLQKKLQNERRNLQMAREYAEAHNYLGAAFKHKGLYEEAIEEYRKSIGFKSNYALAHYNLAKAYALAGNKAESSKSLKKAVELDSRLAETAKSDPDITSVV